MIFSFFSKYVSKGGKVGPIFQSLKISCFLKFKKTKKGFQLMVLTLLNKNNVSVGYKFTHLGSATICESCKLKKVCVDSLEKNKTYVVTEIRKNEHPCLIDNQKMILCNVEETSSTITVKNQKFLDNIVLNRSPIQCNEILCENYDYCLHPSFNEETKIKIVEKIRKIDCPLKYDLILVEANKVN